MSHRLTDSPVPPRALPQTRALPSPHYGLRRHAPLFVRDQFETGVSRTPSSERSRLSVDDRPYAYLSPEAYSRAADLLSSLDKQPASNAAKRRATAYASMPLSEVEGAVHATLQCSTLSFSHLFRHATSLCRGVRMADESVIAIRELCRRGYDPARYGGPGRLERFDVTVQSP